MKGGFRVVATSGFGRELKKLFKKDKEIIGIYEKIIEILKEDAFNGSRTRDIKKLADVKEGEGKWRIRRGNYRFRYDIIKQEVVLHSAKNRRDSYK